MPVIGNIGEKLDLLIKQGSTFGPFEVILSDPLGAPINLTGSSIQAQIRKRPSDTLPIASFDIIIEALNGKFFYSLTDTITGGILAGDTLKDPMSKYFWDMEIHWSNGKIQPLYYGDVTIFREITRV